MRTLSEVIDTLAFHPATPDTAPVHASLRDETVEFASLVWDRIPDGPEKTLAMRGLQTFLMHANCAVAMRAPRDDKNAAIARVLPATICSCEQVDIPADEHSIEVSHRVHRRPADGPCE